MRTAMLRGLAWALLSASIAVPVTAEQRSKTECVATAGLEKHTPGTTTEGTERTGSFDVTLVSSDRRVELTADPKRPVAAGDATKVAATVNRVLLRSPFKSEATALPSTQTPGRRDGSYVAAFDLDAIRALPAGDVDVVLMTADGERVCRIKDADRQKLGAAR